MTLTTYTDLVQRSEDWYAARCGIVTASVVGQLITAKTLKPADNIDSRGLTATLVAERITGYVEPTFTSDDMFRGIQDEPLARDLYSQTYAPVVEAGFMVRDDWGFRIGYSPDGLVGSDGLIEVKSRKQKTQLLTILSGEVPAGNMAQIQCGLLVSGRQWCDYLSYSGGMPMKPIRVGADERWQNAIVEAVRAFEKAAEEMAANYHRAVVGLPMTERVDYSVSGIEF